MSREVLCLFVIVEFTVRGRFSGIVPQLYIINMSSMKVPRKEVIKYVVVLH